MLDPVLKVSLDTDITVWTWCSARNLYVNPEPKIGVTHILFEFGGRGILLPSEDLVIKPYLSDAFPN